jgi:hypothetical protein
MIPFKRSILNVKRIHRPLLSSERYVRSSAGGVQAATCSYWMSAPLYKAASARTTKSLAELPKHKVDEQGNKIGPLPPYIDGKPKKTSKGKGGKGELASYTPSFRVPG